MSKKSLLAGAALLGTVAMLQPGAASAQLYVSGSIGYLSVMDEGTGVNLGAGEVQAEFDPGFALNGAIGYKLPFGVRIEGELGYGRTSLDKLSDASGSVSLGGGDIDLFTGTVNAFYDIKTGTPFTPYLGAGLGFAHESASDVTFRGTTVATGGDGTDFMFLVEAGVAYEVTKNIAVVPAYRYLQINNGTNGGEDSKAHLFKIGLRYTF